MVSTSSITMQSLGKITTIGYRCENMVFVCLLAGLPWSGKLPVLFLLRGQKSAFSTCKGDSLPRFLWNLAEPRARADPGLVNGGRGRGAAGAEGVGFGEGVSPSQRGRGLGRGLCPLPRNFFEFLSRIGAFLCILQSAAVILGSENTWRRGTSTSDGPRCSVSVK